MTLIQFSHILFELIVTLLCLVIAVYVFHTGKRDPKTAWILEGVLLSEVLLNITDALGDYYHGANTGTEADIMQTSNLLVSLFLYCFTIFLTVFTDRILYKRNSEKPVSRRLHKVICLICGVGILLILVYLIACIYIGFIDQTQTFWKNAFGSVLLLHQVSFILLFALVLCNRRLFHLREFKVFLYCTLVLMICPVFQVLLYGLSVFNTVSFFAVVMSACVYQWEISEYTIYRQDVYLTAANIDMLSEEFNRFLNEVGASRQMAITVRLKLEETILRMRERFGEKAKMNIYAAVVFGKPTIQFTLEGDPYNPLAESDSEVKDWSMEMLRGSTVIPRFSYSFGKNYIKLTCPKQKTNPALKMIACILAGLVFGAIGKLLLSEEAMSLFTDHLLDPAYHLLINILSCAAGPVIFFMVINTMLNTGAISGQGISSRAIVARYFLLSGGMAAIAVILLSLSSVDVIRLHRASGEEILQFLEKVIYLVPHDVFGPVIDANTPQLLIMAFVLGCAVVAIGSRGNTLKDLLRQSNLVGMRIAEWIGRLIPYFAILIVAYAFIMARTSVFIMLGTMLLAVLLVSSLFAGGAILYVCVTQDMKARTIVRKCKESLLYAFRTGSAYTAYDSSEECCVEQLGVRRSFALASLPMGTVLYMPANTIGAAVFIVFAEAASGMHISPLWLFGAIVLSVILIAATPPIPGANCMAYMMIISILGIDQQFIILALIFDILFSSFATAANQIMLQMEMIIQSDRAGMLDREKLISS